MILSIGFGYVVVGAIVLILVGFVMGALVWRNNANKFQRMEKEGKAVFKQK